MKFVHSVQSKVGPKLNRDHRGAPNFCSTVPPGSSPRSRSKFTRWPRHFERRVRSRVSAADFFPLGGRPMVTVKKNGGREKQRG